MNYALLGAHVCLVVVFAIAAISKLADPAAYADFRAAVHQIR